MFIKKIAKILSAFAVVFITSCGNDIVDISELPFEKVQVNGFITYPQETQINYSLDKAVAFRLQGCSIIDYDTSAIDANNQFHFYNVYNNSDYIIVLTTYDQYNYEILYKITMVNDLSLNYPAKIIFKGYKSGDIEVKFSTITNEYHLFNLTFDPNNYFNGRVAPFADVYTLDCDITSIYSDIEFFLRNFIYPDIYQFRNF